MKLTHFLLAIVLLVIHYVIAGNGYNILTVKRSTPLSDQVPRALALLEGPHWVSEKQELVYVDIENHKVHRFVPSTGDIFTVNIGVGRVSLIVPVRGQANKYLVGVERDLMILEWDGESSEPTSLVMHKPLNSESSPRSRLNDGKCDPRGRLFAGTMDESGTSNGNLYKLDIDDSLTALVGGVGTSNGLAWAADNNTMYYIDTNTGKVDAFDYNMSAGTIANRRTIFDVWGSGVGGSPDGMTIDSEDNLWVATWGGSKVLNINPREGRLMRTVDFSGIATDITSVAFGGPNLDILYVTTHDSGNPNESGGNLFEVRDLGVTGVGGGIEFCLNC